MTGIDRVQIAPDLTFSRIVYGMWRLADDPDTSPARVRAKIDACLERGVTTVDQADIYGGYASEEIFGAALKENPGLRGELEIVTKCGILVDAGRHAGKVRVKHYDTTRAHIEASVDASLSAMGTDRIDLLLIHRPDPMMDHLETGRALDDLVESGKVRAVGASNFRPWDWDLLRSAMRTPLATNQIELSLLRHEPFVNGDVAAHQSRGEPIMAWSPLGGGAMFAGAGDAPGKVLNEVALEMNAEPGAVAVAWLLRHPANILPVIGTNTPDRVRALSRASELKMDRQTWFRLYEAALGREVA